MFDNLAAINRKPKPFEFYTIDSLWTDAYRAGQMLSFHLQEDNNVASRNKEFVEKAATWMAEHFSLKSGGKVCDFGCGPGLYTTQLAKRGAKVTGIDFSVNSIEHAQKVANSLPLEINYIQANYLEVGQFDRFDLITMIMWDYCALSPSQRLALLKLFKQNLDANGRVLLDVFSINMFDQKQEAASYEKNQLNHFWFKEDYYAFVNSFKYLEEKVSLDKYTLFAESGAQEIVYNWLQYFSVESLRQEVQNAGFDIKMVLADVAGSPFSEDKGEFAVILSQV